MVTLRAVERLIEETWLKEVRDEVGVYEVLGEKVNKSNLFFELESNLSHNFYYQLKKKLISKKLFPEIFIDVQGSYPIERGHYTNPDMMFHNKNGPLIAIEIKCRNRGNVSGARGYDGQTPSKPEVEEDIIKLPKYYEQNKLKRTYLFLFSKSSWSTKGKTGTTDEAIAALKDAKHMKIGYGFYEEDKWGFWEHPFDYLEMLKNPE